MKFFLNFCKTKKKIHLKKFYFAIYFFISFHLISFFCFLFLWLYDNFSSPTHLCLTFCKKKKRNFFFTNEIGTNFFNFIEIINEVNNFCPFSNKSIVCCIGDEWTSAKIPNTIWFQYKSKLEWIIRTVICWALNILSNLLEEIKKKKKFKILL